jgi:hypothetical protein
MNMTLKLSPLLIIISVFFTINSNSQIFYYSGTKKILLKSDTTKIFINIKKNETGQTLLNKLSEIDGVLSADRTSDRNIVSINTSSLADKKKIYSLIKNENNVRYAWGALKLDNLPLASR